MEIGFALPVSGTWATAENCIEISESAERLGYHSVWTFQRLLSPVTAEGLQWLPPAYHSVLDPLSVLAFAAARTTRVRLGVAVVNAPFMAPVQLAKVATTIDRLSNGRLDLGIGSGWMADEFTAAGAQFDRRGAQMTEYIEALDVCFAGGVSSFNGEFSTLPASVLSPTPIQRPRPQLLLGGAAPAALRRVGKLADGWISASTTDLTTVGESVDLIRRSAIESGRDPDELRFICRGVVRVRNGERAPLTGGFDEIRTDIAELATQGITEVFIDLNFDPEIGSPDADPEQSMRRARRALEELAP
jgi:probable F420-dependent oxidoreductase